MKKTVFLRFKKGKLSLLFKKAIEKAGSVMKLSKSTGIDIKRIYDYKNEVYGIKFGINIITINKIINFLGINNNSLEKYIIEKTYSAWTREELDFLKVNYKKMTAREISKKINRSIYAIKDERKKLNLKKGPRYRWGSKTKIINRFKELYKKLGRTPTYDECEKFDGGMMNAINLRWKRYSHFLKELGLTVKFNKWSKESCIKRFKKFVRRHDYLPTNHEPIYKAITRRWGSYRNFLKEMRVSESLITGYKWKEWENLVIRICKNLYGNVSIKGQLNKKRLYPDVSVLNDKGEVIKLIDAKLSCYLHKKEISKYYKYCKNIEFWCLHGHGYKKFSEDGIKILDSDKIKKNLEKFNLSSFIKEIEELKRPC